MTPKRKAFSFALALWPLFLAGAVGLGLLREGVLAPALGEQPAHVVGTLLFVAFLLAVMWPFVRRFGATLGVSGLWLVGVVWTAMTVCFEFLFFHFVAGVPLEELLADYDILAGRVWVVVLLTTLCGPVALGRWQARREA